MPVQALPDAAWLAQMARGIFQAGISWQVVDSKWPGIEEAFRSFDPGAVAMLDEDGIEALLNDRRVIRSGPKILAIRENEIAADSCGVNVTYYKTLGFVVSSQVSNTLATAKFDSIRLLTPDQPNAAKPSGTPVPTRKSARPPRKK